MEVLHDSKLNQRNNTFQKSFNEDKLRRKREENQVNLRKQKRNLQILKKRLLHFELPKAEPVFMPLFEDSWVPAGLSEKYPDLLNHSLTAATRLNLLISHILTVEDLNTVYYLVQTLRKLLACESIPPFGYIMSSGVSSRIIELLLSSNKDVQKEALWCVINLTTGSSDIVKELINQGVINNLKPLLDERDLELLEMTIWCLGNIAGDCIENRDLLVSTAGRLVKIIDEVPPGVWKNTVWTLSNLCRGKPLPDRSVTNTVLSIIPKVLKSGDEQLISDCCWALSYISDGDNERIQDILDLDIVKQLVSLLSKDLPNIVIPSLRTLGSVAAGTEEQTQKILNLGLVDKIAPFLSSNKTCLKREALWALSNVTAGNDEQINLVLRHPCISLVISCLKDPDFEIKKEALWVLSNATHAKSASIALKIIELGAFEQICEILGLKDAKILMVALEAVNNLLKAGSSICGNESEGKINEVALKFDEIGGLSKMEDLQEHPNVKIYKKVVEIMEQHYGLIEVNDENEEPPKEFCI